MTSNLHQTSRAVLSAREVLSLLGLAHPTYLPVEEMAYALDISGVHCAPLEGAEGRIITKHGKFLITYSSHIKSPGKKRFVLAHEIGHYCLHKDYLLRQRVHQDNNKSLMGLNGIEKEANAFAAELLLPTHLLKPRFTNEVPSIEEFANIATEFQTSILMAILRYANLGSTPICVVCTKLGKVSWRYSSPSFCLQYIRTGREVWSGTIAGKFHNGSSDFFQVQEITAEPWFVNDFKCDHYIGEFFMEQAYAVSEDTMVTVIWRKSA